MTNAKEAEMEIRKFTLDVAVKDGAPAIDVADAVEEAVKSAHHDVLAVELRFGCGDEPGKAPTARKKRKYVRRAKPAEPEPRTRVERRGTIPAGANAPEAT